MIVTAIGAEGKSDDIGVSRVLTAIQDGRSNVMGNNRKFVQPCISLDSLLITASALDARLRMLSALFLRRCFETQSREGVIPLIDDSQ